MEWIALCTKPEEVSMGLKGLVSATQSTDPQFSRLSCLERNSVYFSLNETVQRNTKITIKWGIIVNGPDSGTY